MFWEILAWAAVVLLYVFRIALVVGFVAVVVLIVAHAARAEAACAARRRAGTQVARRTHSPRSGATGPGRAYSAVVLPGLDATGRHRDPGASAHPDDVIARRGLPVAAEVHSPGTSPCRSAAPLGFHAQVCLTPCLTQPQRTVATTLPSRW